MGIQSNPALVMDGKSMVIDCGWRGGELYFTGNGQGYRGYGPEFTCQQCGAIFRLVAEMIKESNVSATDAE